MNYRQRLRTATVRQHAGARPERFLRALLFDWLVIVAAVALVVGLYPSPFVWLLVPLSWLVIASRQHALLILMHEATHGLAHPNRQVNELLGELATAMWMGVSMVTYRQAHLQHHAHTNTENDPDWTRKLFDADEARSWRFPMPVGRFVGLTGMWLRSVRYLMRSLKDNSAVGAEAQNRVEHLGRYRLALLFCGAVLLTWSGGWMWFVLLWLVPLVVVLPLIMRLRSIAEHFALANDHELTATRTLEANAVERFLFVPHNIGYHLEHHLLASVSFGELPRVRSELMKCADYAERGVSNSGYVSGDSPLFDELFAKPVAVLPEAVSA